MEWIKLVGFLLISSLVVGIGLELAEDNYLKDDGIISKASFILDKLETESTISIRYTGKLPNLGEPSPINGEDLKITIYYNETENETFVFEKEIEPFKELMLPVRNKSAIIIVDYKGKELEYSYLIN